MIFCFGNKYRKEMLLLLSRQTEITSFSAYELSDMWKHSPSEKHPEISVVQMFKNIINLGTFSTYSNFTAAMPRDQAGKTQLTGDTLFVCSSSAILSLSAFSLRFAVSLLLLLRLEWSTVPLTSVLWGWECQFNWLFSSSFSSRSFVCTCKQK